MTQNTTQAPTIEQASQAAAPLDQDALDLKALARAVLDRSMRPRTASIRRLAEAVLAKAEHKQKKAGKSAKKSSKLAKIPGQKGKKKG